MGSSSAQNGEVTTVCTKPSYHKDIKTLWHFQRSAVWKLQDCGIGNAMECHALECTTMNNKIYEYYIKNNWHAPVCPQKVMK